MITSSTAAGLLDLACEKQDAGFFSMCLSVPIPHPSGKLGWGPVRLATA